MSRIALALALVGFLVGCSDLNKKVATFTHDGTPQRHSFAGPVTFLLLSTPPGNTILVSSCQDEFAIEPYKRSLCELNHKLRGTTSPWERAEAEARLMSYRPGELQCTRTLGGVSDCRVISGMPRPTLLSAPNMGSN